MSGLELADMVFTVFHRRGSMAELCQSCSMPMNKDKYGGGTNADGSKSERYCSLCYLEGAFTQPDVNAQQMQDFCVEQLKKQGMPGVMAWLLTRSIPKLERWQQS